MVKKKSIIYYRMANKCQHWMPVFLFTFMKGTLSSVVDLIFVGALEDKGKRSQICHLFYIQLSQLILGRFTFYAMIWGYFDMLKVALKVMPRPWASGSKHILVELSNELLWLNCLAQTVSKLSAVKVGNKKNLETFWVWGNVLRENAIVNLVFGRPGFDSRSLQTLRASNF